MSSLVPPLATEVVSAAAPHAYAGGLPVLALLLLLVLLVAKQTSVSIAGVQYRRLSRVLDVGLAPLAMAALAITAHEAWRILG